MNEYERELFHGPNAAYMIDLYERYCQDPGSVDPSTRAFFDAWSASGREREPPEHPLSERSEPAGLPSVAAAAPAGANVAAPASNQNRSPAPAPAPAQPAPWSRRNFEGDADDDSRVLLSDVHLGGHAISRDGMRLSAGQRMLGEVVEYHIPDIVSAARLTRFVRELGHLDARIDPLGSKPPGDPGLGLETHGLTREKLAELPSSVVRSPLAEGADNALMAIDRMREVYCGSIGYEDDHVQVHEERAWIREAAETRRFFHDFDAPYKQEILERLTEVEAFERFLHQIFPGQKRFSIEGNDMLVPMLDSIIHNAAMAGTHEVVLGMAHRGRLNVLAHILGKTYSAILAEFQGPNFYNKGTYLGWTGDVKYHLGARRAYRESGVFEMPLTLVPNPSHLEAVNPVVQGRARAAQEQRDRPGEPLKDPSASLPVLVHGDASFPGQGVVAETLNLSRLAGYHVGGTIHIIINNQIGFTTNWQDSRSTLYASDLAKGFAIPIVHVNADDPYACIAAARMAWAYREHFHKDFLIDLVGYRRWGHNEGDEPSFTQPLMYERISDHPTVREQWARQLEHEGVIDSEKAQATLQTVQSRLKRAQREVEKGGRIQATVAVPVSTLVHRPVSDPHPVSRERLIQLDRAMTTYPDRITPHTKLDRLIQRRAAILEEGGGVDWAHAEALAFAIILLDGIPIRLTGQDVERGTFSQRHLVLHDTATGEHFVPLQQAITQAQASFSIYNSPLSENAAVGFEYGYSSHAPDTLVLWEAQFGDFCNGAQVCIDQFLVSGSAKWGQTPAMVLLLPHGYEGQGPEHSSARLERFLQLAADNNIRVVNCTTAAQYFHVLRRQAATLQRDPRPLVIMTPKSLLRNPHAASTLRDLVDGKFQPVLPPVAGSSHINDIRRLVLCSGKVYYDLVGQGEVKDVPSLPEGLAVARVEELYPFPETEIDFIIRNYRHLQEVVWLQEEPHNMGAWRYMEPRLRGMVCKRVTDHEECLPVMYCGRPEAASPAEGALSLHQQEQARIVREALAMREA